MRLKRSIDLPLQGAVSGNSSFVEILQTPALSRHIRTQSETTIFRHCPCNFRTTDRVHVHRTTAAALMAYHITKSCEVYRVVQKMDAFLSFAHSKR